MQEKVREVLSGWVMLPLAVLLWLGVPALIVIGAWLENPWLIPPIVLLLLAAGLTTKGFFTLQPNEARVLILFGRYVGTVRKDGFHWANPFAVIRGPFITTPQAEKNQVQIRMQQKCRVSLRARNFETQTVKVNDLRGNPIEIGAVVVWQIADTAKALFDVDEYENYVHVQSETAVRHLANSYPYDHSGDSPDDELTLRGNSEAVCATLEKELQNRLNRAGVVVQEARLTHLAYAPEIAGAMLRRQQAEAIIAARQKIVHGAVSMVQMALKELADRQVLELDEERKAAMVSNLLVVLCSDRDAEPVINAGTLYQ